jgi:hypothetical protein
LKIRFFVRFFFIAEKEITIKYPFKSCQMLFKRWKVKFLRNIVIQQIFICVSGYLVLNILYSGTQNIYWVFILILCRHNFIFEIF